MADWKWIESKQTTDRYREWHLYRGAVMMGGVEKYRNSPDFYFWIEATGETWITVSLERAQAGLENLIAERGTENDK